MDTQGCRWQGWGPWRLDVTDLGYPCLRHESADYPVDLTGCTSSAEVLDWIMQVVGKTWADDVTIAGLVRAFDDVLSPQENLCSMGQSRTLHRGELRELIEHAAIMAPRWANQADQP